MQLYIGLGNPGSQYLQNRHNVGFLCLDSWLSRIAQPVQLWKNDQKYGAEWARATDTIIFAKPQTFMNRSGEAVVRLMQFYKIIPENVTVIHDDLDIEIGKYKISIGKGPKLHNGITSVEQKIGKQFRRIRIGVENRNPDNRIPGEAYVLQDFTLAEHQLLEPVFSTLFSQYLSPALHQR